MRIKELLLEYLKRDYKKIILWILGLGLFAGGFVPAFIEIAKDSGLEGIKATLENPAMRALVGNTPDTEYTVGAMYSHTMLLFSAVFAMIISIMHIIKHTRKEEESGLTEQILSFKLNKLSPSISLLLENIIINITLGIFITLIMVITGDASITIRGSILFALSISLVGIFGGSIAHFFAQIMPSSSNTTISSLALIGILFILRGITDITYTSFSYLNPLAWTYLTYPFTNNNYHLLFLLILLIIIISLISLNLEKNRDLGSSYIKEKEGRKEAKKSLLSIRGLFIRLNKKTIISYLLGFFILGASYGAVYGDMHTFLESNELIKSMFTYTGVSIEESFTAVIMLVMILIITVLPIVIINKLYTEEKNLNQLLSTKITRKELFFSNVNIAIITSFIGIILTAIGLGGTALYVMENSTMTFSDFLAAGINYFPAILFFIGLTSITIGYFPKFRKTIYIYLGYSFIINYFNNILNIPNNILKTTIHSYIPAYPIHFFNLGTFFTITLISIILIVIGYQGYKKRDLHN